jgi:hypothetical protein
MARGYGLDSRRLRSMIKDKLKEHPDLFYYIEDPYVKELPT